MTPQSIPELEMEAFRRALAAALEVPARRPAAAWDPLGSVELEHERPSEPTDLRRAA